MKGRSHEPIWWSLFGMGGIIAAVFVPVIIFVTGIGGAAGWDAVTGALAHGEDGIGALLRHAPVRAVLGLILALAAVHAAHRIRHTLIDLHVHAPPAVLIVASYGAAAVVSVLIAIVLALF
ncbi:MAG: fumarate reductase subunit D [Chloroflexi bacterium]|nr:fumarate reductase subunit D [Chloroflexota bacterium]